MCYEDQRTCVLQGSSPDFIPKGHCAKASGMAMVALSAAVGLNQTCELD